MEARIKEMISEMTLEEKAGLCSGADTWRLKAVERLGIPSVMVSDGPHGLRKQEGRTDHLGLNESVKAVCFPAASALASSFDEELLYEVGDALGEECRAEDIAVLLGPAVNIKRSPLCGRNFEYFSEDPYLAGKLASAQIKGVQKWNVGTSLKHFAANSQEHCRMTCSSNLSERTLREIYLPAFETAVKEGKPWSVMCSYNKLNGTFASENHWLLTDILKKEWGFDGFVVSDWGAVNDRVLGLLAGLDLEMPSSHGVGDEQIVEAVKAGKVPEEVLDEAVARILKKIFEYTENKHPEAVFDREAHHAIAAQAEMQCAVLLKNNGVLPLSRSQKIAYIGGFAKTPRYQGGGSSHINPSRVSSALEAAREKCAPVYAKGFATDNDVLDEKMLAEAVEAAQNAQVAVIFAGLPDIYESEGYDRSHMRMPKNQERVIEEVLRVQKNTVIVLHNGSPVEMPWADNTAAILEMYLGGEGVGEAADALLYGEENPSGRLPETFPMYLEQTPAYLNFPGDGQNVDYNEGVFVGYRYYEKKKMPVRFPFGHGLSYTTFEYSNMRLSENQSKEEEFSIKVYVDVTNTGKVRGRETVQIYVADKTGTPGRPIKELKGFVKTDLNPGEKKTVEIELDTRAFQWYNESLGKWFAAAGKYVIYAAHSSEDLRLRCEFSYEAVTTLPMRVDRNTTIAQLMAHPVTAPMTGQMLAGFKAHLPQNQSAAAGSSPEGARENTAAGSSLEGARGNTAAGSSLEGARGNTAADSSSDGAQEAKAAGNGGGLAMNPKMLKEMVFNAPLRALVNFRLMDDAAMERLADRFNTLLKDAGCLQE